MADGVVVYTFSNGFQKEAESIYGWLRHANLTPSWDFLNDPKEGYITLIKVPAGEVSCLRMMQRAYPARWGNPPACDDHWHCDTPDRSQNCPTCSMPPVQL